MKKMLKRDLTDKGAVLIILALDGAIFLCTNTRIDPAVRTAYETQAQPVDQSGDFALFLQMTGVQDTTAAPEKPSGVVPYGLALGAAALAGLILFCLCVPRKKRGAALFAGGLSLLLGFVLARLVFWVCNASFYLGLYSDPLSLFRVRDGGLCMTGALLGAGLTAAGFTISISFFICPLLYVLSVPYCTADADQIQGNNL